MEQEMRKEVFIVTLKNNDPEITCYNEITFLAKDLSGALAFIESRKTTMFMQSQALDAFRQGLRISFAHAWRRTCASSENSYEGLYSVNVESSAIWEEASSQKIVFDEREDGTKPLEPGVREYVQQWYDKQRNEPQEEMTAVEREIANSFWGVLKQSTV